MLTLPFYVVVTESAALDVVVELLADELLPSKLTELQSFVRSTARALKDSDTKVIRLDELMVECMGAWNRMKQRHITKFVAYYRRRIQNPQRLSLTRFYIYVSNRVSGLSGEIAEGSGVLPTTIRAQASFGGAATPASHSDSGIDISPVLNEINEMAKPGKALGQLSQRHHQLYRRILLMYHELSLFGRTESAFAYVLHFYGVRSSHNGNHHCTEFLDIEDCLELTHAATCLRSAFAPRLFPELGDAFTKLKPAFDVSQFVVPHKVFVGAQDWEESFMNVGFKAKVRPKGASPAEVEALFDQLRNTIVRNMDIIHKTFVHYTGGMGDSGGIGLGKRYWTWRMNDFNDFVEETHIAEEIGEGENSQRLPGLEMLSLRDVFAHVASDYHDKGVVVDKVTGLGLRREQFLEVLVLIAQMQAQEQSVPDLVTALDRLINTYLRTNSHFCPTDIGYWYRKQRIYIEHVCEVLADQMPVLQRAFQRFKKTAAKLSLSAWVSFVRTLITFSTEDEPAPDGDLKLLPSPTNRTYVNIFFQSSDYRAPDASGSKRQDVSLDFCDFLEAIVRLADALPFLPSADQLAAVGAQSVGGFLKSLSGYSSMSSELDKELSVMRKMLELHHEAFERADEGAEAHEHHHHHLHTGDQHLREPGEDLSTLLKLIEEEMASHSDVPLKK